MSSSPNLLNKDDDGDDPVADGGGEDDSSDEYAGEEVVEIKHHWMDLLQGFSLMRKTTLDALPQVNGRNNDGMMCEE